LAPQEPASHAAGYLASKPPTGPSEGDAVTTMTTGIQLDPDGRPQLAAGSWRVDPAHSHASFAARVAGRSVRGRLPLSGDILITEPIENSTARLAARTTAVSTGSPVLDRLLTGSSFLDARAFPQITFQSERLVWVPTGWRSLGRLQVKDAEHELACQLDVDLPDKRPSDPRHIIIASRWVIDSRWITSQWVPAFDRRIMMTCSSLLEPNV
jgi:polyisoprenoid-binding protein YceI